jgi:hypothetical protein
LSSWKNLTNAPIEPGTNNPTSRGETPDPVGQRSARWSRAFTATACVALIVSGSVACGAANKTPSAKAVPAPGNDATTTTAATTATGVRHGIETLGLPPTTSSTTATPPTRPQTCAQRAAVNRYIDIQSVTPGDTHSIAITFHAATLICGGADDSHFETSGPTFRATVELSSPLGILENGPTNIIERQTTASELPGVFTHLLYGHTFLADKNSTGTIVNLQQQYHP